MQNRLVLKEWTFRYATKINLIRVLVLQSVLSWLLLFFLTTNNISSVHLYENGWLEMMPFTTVNLISHMVHLGNGLCKDAAQSMPEIFLHFVYYFNTIILPIKSPICAKYLQRNILKVPARAYQHVLITKVLVMNYLVSILVHVYKSTVEYFSQIYSSFLLWASG